MARFSTMAAVLFAAALLAPHRVAAAEQNDVATKLEAFEGVDHFAADPDGSYKGVADPKLRAKLNRVVDRATASVAAGIRKGVSAPDLLRRLNGQLWVINPKDLEPQDAERVTKAFVQLFSLAGLSQYDRILIQWLFNYDAHKPARTAAPLPDTGQGG